MSTDTPTAFPGWGERPVTGDQEPSTAIDGSETMEPFPRSWNAPVDPDPAGSAIAELPTDGDPDAAWRPDLAWRPDTGATTAEYAITTLAACGFAALLVVILKSEPVKDLITGVIQGSLGLGS